MLYLRYFLIKRKRLSGRPNINKETYRYVKKRKYSNKEFRRFYSEWTSLVSEIGFQLGKIDSDIISSIPFI